MLPVSAKSGEGLAALRDALKCRLVGTGPLEHPVLTDGRHAAALTRVREALERTLTAADAGMSEELLLEDLKLARRELGTITGEFGVEELYDRVFSTFCIGK